MALIAFRRGQDQAGRWRDGRLREEEPPPLSGPAPVTAAADPGEEARSFYESLIAEGETPREPPGEEEKQPKWV